MASWLLTMKPAFLNQLTALPAKEVAQVNRKLSLLLEDPHPDAKVKKKLKHLDYALYRLRSGDYRIFYTFEEPYVSVLGLSRRNESTYDGMPEAEELGGLNPDLGGSAPPAWQRWIEGPTSAEDTALPARITAELLENLRVPKPFHARLVEITTEEALFDAEDVPDEVRLRVHDALSARPVQEVLREPDLVASDVDDLLRFKEGELLGFLLRLNPEQEKYVSFALNAKGPTLLKGGPGTGKSTVALYRAKAMVEAQKKKGTKAPRLLFTTYTRALIRFSEQLLGELLGDDARYVEVKTADALARKITDGHLTGLEICSTEGFKAIVADARRGLELEGNPLEVRAQEAALDKLGVAYLTEELLSVIQPRDLQSLDAYLAAPRPGRLERLTKTGRAAVWALHERTQDILRRRRFVTWPQIRVLAGRLVAEGESPKAYDAVLVDEAQDLDPAALRLLVSLAKSKGRLFLTADANQSIYGAGFRWKDVHEDLAFVGRTGILRANHRSTAELGEAARAYLSDGVLDEEDEVPAYVSSGPEPAVRSVKDEGDQARLLQRFLPAAARELRLGLKACAVLTPSKKEGAAIAEDLRNLGLQATFMTSNELDLGAPGVKVLPLQAAKGLEFPVVALAGFLDGAYPYPNPKDSPEVQAEALRRARRTMYVAMTRAMRALLVIMPEHPTSPVFSGFDAEHWNLGEKA